MIDVNGTFSFSVALDLMKRGMRCARYGFTKSGTKWVQLHPGNDGILSHLELVYPHESDAFYAGYSVPWLPSRCDLLECDWFLVHPQRTA